MYVGQEIFDFYFVPKQMNNAFFCVSAIIVQNSIHAWKNRKRLNYY